MIHSINDRFVYFVVVLALLCGCKKSDDPVAVVTPVKKDYLIAIDGTAIKNPQDVPGWYYVSDNTGKVLALSKFRSDSIMYLNGKTTQDSLTLTVVTELSSAPYFRSFTALKKNTLIVLRPKTPVIIKPQKGSVEVDLNNYNPFAFNNDYLFGSSPDASSFSGSFSSTASTWILNLTSDTTTAYFSGTRNGVPVYKYLTHLKVNDKLTDDFQTYKVCPRTVGIQFNGYVYALLKGYPHSDVNEYFRLSDHANSKPAISPLGWVDGFNVYETDVSGTISDHENISYVKVGTPPTSILLPSTEITKSFTSIADAKFSVNQDADFGYSLWTIPIAGSAAGWEVYFVSNMRPVIPEFPSEILAKWPDLNQQNAVLAHVSLFDVKDSWSYTDHIDATLNGFLLQPREYFEYRTVP